ncbi:TetR/AcrR family transcriptional regulator [Nocardia inohanensis]|uniref:TetR/AcrR family transcriptional regulator n=1 Tax=Nocardia inohanensis TaxID=209246 RepID=UPI001FE010F7|nr:TetR/AcrR family transcriptional regulator [Nocardia inohanensis]
MAIRDAREQLFEAAERILLRDGPSALTSRAVTTEAGCAKGVLHRHFADFDAFLVELVQDRIVRVQRQSEALNASAGSGSVVENLTEAISLAFGPVAVAVVSLITFRDEVRSRLRATRPVGVPLIADIAEMIASYLRVERELGRLERSTDIDTLAPTLIGAGHLLFADRTGAPPTPEAVRSMVTAVVGASATG